MKKPFNDQSLRKLHRDAWNTSLFMWGSLALFLTAVSVWWIQSSIRHALTNEYIVTLQVIFATFVFIAFSCLEIRLIKLRSKIRHLDVSNQIHRAPGWKLLSVASFAFSKKTYSNLLVPIILDLQEEYFDALSQNRIWKARWIRIRGTWSFFAAIGMDRALLLCHFSSKLGKA
jgi:hypothetical protein